MLFVKVIGRFGLARYDLAFTATSFVINLGLQIILAIRGKLAQKKA
jgi:hypothetical protein